LRSRLCVEDEDRAFADGHLLLSLLHEDTETDAVEAAALPSASSAQWPREVFVWFFLDRVNEVDTARRHQKHVCSPRLGRLTMPLPFSTPLPRSRILKMPSSRLRNSAR
ncbi:GABRQ, partial [Symbiodinium sp. CCMP2592]